MTGEETKQLVEYNIKEEVFRWLKEEGYTNLLKLMEFTK